MQSFGRSLGYTLRGLVRAPVFSIIAVLTLAVGIGANSAIFSVVNGVLLKPLPFDEPERLVGVWHKAPGLGFDEMNQGPAFHFTYREQSRVFDDVGMWDNGTATVTGLAAPEQVDALWVTDGTLPILRVRPELGRLFNAEDDSPGRPETVILSYSYWQRMMGGDPGVVGRKLLVNGKPRDIIGVLPQSFRFLRFNPSLILPLQIDRNKVFVGNFSYQGIARLKAGVTIDQANADVARMIQIAARSFPLPPGFSLKMLEDARLGPNIRPLKQDAVGDIGKVLWVLLGTVGIVLLIACANVANLFLVRAEGRQQELAVRSALGAGSGRIARELLSESLLLAIVGGICGLALAFGGIRLLLALGPDSVPRLNEITIDPAVLAFTLVISLLAGLLFGLFPVIKFARPNLVSALKEGGRASSDGRLRQRARSGLVISQVALALVLLISSGLLVRTFQALRNVHPGFVRPQEVLTMRISIPTVEAPKLEQSVRTHERILRRIEEIPGVAAVGLSSSITMDGNDSNDPIFVEEFPTPEGQIPPIRRFKWVSPNYFATMGNPILAGRDYTWTDIYNKSRYVIITDNLARHYWKNPADALGKRVRTTPTNPWREIIGVVGNVHDNGVNRDSVPTVYWPMLVADFWDNALFAPRNLGYAIRSDRTGSPAFLKEVRQAVWSVNPNLPLASVRGLDEILEESMARTSFTVIMLGIAASVALLLGLVGIYGVVSYTVAQRTREIGIRIALGARPGEVRRLFVRQGFVLACAGVVLGLGAAAGLTRLMSALLFGVSSLDAATFAVVSASLAAVALLATWLPARRASAIDPVDALRWE